MESVRKQGEAVQEGNAYRTDNIVEAGNIKPAQHLGDILPIQLSVNASFLASIILSSIEQYRHPP